MLGEARLMTKFKDTPIETFPDALASQSATPGAAAPPLLSARWVLRWSA
jgi:hypothetical protein